MQPSLTTPEYAAPGKRLFRFWDSSGPFFKINLEQLICRNHLYLSARSNFNDPFDLHPIVKCDWTISGIRQHAQNIFENPLQSAASPEKIISALEAPRVKADFSLKNMRQFKQKFPQYMAELLDAMGICCFTDEMQNPVFWALYAGSYTGVCAEFAATGDVSHPFFNMMKVHYATQRPTIYASQTGALSTVYGDKTDWKYIAQYGMCTKAIDWCVEREWRWWAPQRATTFQALPHRSFRRLFVGPRASDATRALVVGLAKKSAASLPIFETKLSDSEFRINHGRRLY